ncbi:MAG: hypothetical protein ACR2I5_03705 [Candidatus Limnocylindria bacterium]
MKAIQNILGISPKLPKALKKLMKPMAARTRPTPKTIGPPTRRNVRQRC